jgi:hypothetical protein
MWDEADASRAKSAVRQKVSVRPYNRPSNQALCNPRFSVFAKSPIHSTNTVGQKFLDERLSDCRRKQSAEKGIECRQKREFQFETARGTFLRNLPFCPIHFATLEIETRNAREPYAGVSILLVTFRWPFGFAQASKSFGWTNLATNYLE